MAKFLVITLLVVLAAVEFGQSLKCWKCDECKKDKSTWTEQECAENERCEQVFVTTQYYRAFNRRSCVPKETRCGRQYAETYYSDYYGQWLENGYSCEYCDDKDLCNDFSSSNDD